MITKYTEYTVVCDICEVDPSSYGGMHWLAETDYTNFQMTIEPSHKGKRDARKIVKEYGWVYKNGNDICPKCQEKLRKSNVRKG